MASLFLPANLSAPPFSRLAKNAKICMSANQNKHTPSGFSAIGSLFVATAILTNCLHCFLFSHAIRGLGETTQK